MPKPRYDVSCKLGTVPKLVRVHGSDPIEVGAVVRIQEGHNHRWQAVIVTKINDDGYFFADLYMSGIDPEGPTIRFDRLPAAA